MERSKLIYLERVKCYLQFGLVTCKEQPARLQKIYLKSDLLH